MAREIRLSEANARLSAVGAGGIQLGRFTEFEGGELTMEAFTITDEDGKKIVLPGLSGDRSPVIVRRPQKQSDIALRRQVERALNAGAVSDSDGVTVVYIDGRKVAFGDPDVYTGVLLGAASGNVNLANGATAKMFVCTFAVDQDLAL